MSIDFLESVSMAVRTLSANKMRSSLIDVGHHHWQCLGDCHGLRGSGSPRFVNQQFQSLGTNLLFVVRCGERSANGTGASNSLCPPINWC